MSGIRAVHTERILTVIGSLALVFQLIVFQDSLGVVKSPGVSGTLRDVLSGGLLLVAVCCLAGGLYVRWKNS
jgi:acid phosphatase family membrane protein YuiD